MAKELEHSDTPGLTVYTRPLPLTASVADAIAMTEEASNPGYYTADVANPVYPYAVFHQTGASAALTDGPAMATTDGLRVLVSAIPTAGTGAEEVTITWTNTTTGLPVADGDVWITTDAAGTNVVAGTLQTDSAGQAMFLLDAGVTYYLFAQKDGVNSITGEEFVAVAD